jgi:hypothetical protein
VAAGTTWENPGNAAEIKNAASDSLINCLKTMPHLLLKLQNLKRFSDEFDVSDDVQDGFFLEE